MSTNINPPVPSGNFRVGRNGWVPDLIVLHTTTNTTQSAINWITNPTSNVSYHVIIAANGNVTRAVDIGNTAFANGTGTGNRHHSHSTNHLVRSRTANANDYTISIAFGDMNLNQGNLTLAQINTAAMHLNILRAEIMMRWNRWVDLSRMTIIGHNEVTPLHTGRNGCPILAPATSFPFVQIIQRLHELPILLPFSSEDTMSDYLGDYVGVVYNKEDNYLPQEESYCCGNHSEQK